MLYYIHGYQSNPDSAKGTLFKQVLQANAIKYRDGQPEDLVIADCLHRVAQTIENDDDVVLIGSSFGGFLAAATALEHTTVKQLILLNPAVIPPSTDLSTYTSMPRRILTDMVNKKLFETRLNVATFILMGTEDDVIPHDWILAFAMAQEATVHFLHDDHQFSQNLHLLPELIKTILI
jgi:predicted esterase YcpF (UPF0227 family)